MNDEFMFEESSYSGHDQNRMEVAAPPLVLGSVTTMTADAEARPGPPRHDAVRRAEAGR
jgi:hypothetical protein